MHFDPTAFVADPELIGALERHSTAIHCDSDRVLFEQGEPAVGLYVLRQGRATLTMYTEGQAVISVETGPGALLGLPGVVASQPYSMTGVAQAGAEVEFIDREKFAALMQSNPKLSFKILQVLAAEVRTARSALS